VNPVTSLDVDLSVAMLGQPANPTIHGNQLWLPRIDGVGRVVKVTADRYVQVCWGEPLCIKVTEWDWRIVAAPDEDLVWMPTDPETLLFPPEGAVDDRTAATTAMDSTAIATYRDFRQDAFVADLRRFMPQRLPAPPYRLRVRQR